MGYISRHKDANFYGQVQCFVTIFNSTLFVFIEFLYSLSLNSFNKLYNNIFFVLLSYFHYFSSAVFESTYKTQIARKRSKEKGQNQPSESVTRIGGERSPPDLSDLEAGDIRPCDKSEPI